MKRHLISIIVVCLALIFSSSLDAQIHCIEPDATTGASQAVAVEAVPLAHTAQFLPLNAKGEIVGQGDARKQAEQVLTRLDEVLQRAKSNLGQTVKLNVYVARAELSAAVSEVLAKRFKGKIKPAMTFVGGDLPHPKALVAMDAVAVSKIKTTGHAPVHFLQKNSNVSEVTVLPPTDAVYVAGLADKNELSLATKITMEKIESGIAHLGLKRSDIAQLKAFLLPMSKVEEVKRAIEEFFDGETVPPIVYVDWLSPGVPVEIEAIVAAPKSSAASNVTFHTPTGITASPVYSRLARVHGGKRIYISGLYGQTAEENDVKEIFSQLDDLLKKTGSNRDHMAKATYYYSDPKSNVRLDAFRPTYYNPKTPPAASKSRAKDVGRAGRGIVIDIIAVSTFAKGQE